jgi:hypothetical protein
MTNKFEHTMPLSPPLLLHGRDDRSKPSINAADTLKITTETDVWLPNVNFSCQHSSINSIPATPLLHLSFPTSSSCGCDLSLTSDNRSQQALQPHDSMYRKNKKGKKKELTTIYTLWHCPRDAEGNILIDQPPQPTKTGIDH